MPGKKGTKKLEKLISLSFDEPLFDELTAVANANNTSAQELLRYAARAIVRCHHATVAETGRVNETIPTPMEIVSLPTRSRHVVFDPMLNEPPASAADVAQRVITSQLSRNPPPAKGSAPASHGKNK